MERVRRELGDMKEDILSLRVKEERSLSTMDEMGQRLDHVAKGEEIALRRINKINQSGQEEQKHGKKHSLKKHLKYKQRKHKNLSRHSRITRESWRSWRITRKIIIVLTFNTK